MNLQRCSTSEPPSGILAADHRKSRKTGYVHRFQHAGESPFRRPVRRSRVARTRREILMIAHQTDMHSEEDTTTMTGRAKTVERTSRTASRRLPLPYAASYPPVGRHGAGLGRSPVLDGRIQASIRWKRPKIHIFSTVEVGRRDAASGLGAGPDFVRVDSSCLGNTRKMRIRATNLGMGLAAAVAPEAFCLCGLRRRSCSLEPFRR